MLAFAQQSHPADGGDDYAQLAVDEGVGHPVELSGDDVGVSCNPEADAGKEVKVAGLFLEGSLVAAEGQVDHRPQQDPQGLRQEHGFSVCRNRLREGRVGQVADRGQDQEEDVLVGGLLSEAVALFSVGGQDDADHDDDQGNDPEDKVVAGLPFTKD